MRLKTFCSVQKHKLFVMDTVIEQAVIEYLNLIVASYPEDSSYYSIPIPPIVQHLACEYVDEVLGTVSWDKFNIIKVVTRWNNISHFQVSDRETNTDTFDMMIIPITKSVHGDSLVAVKDTYCRTRDILENFGRRSTDGDETKHPVCNEMIDFGTDEFSFHIVTKTPHLESFPAMMSELHKNGELYSEAFVCKTMKSILEMVIECHDRDIVNLNLNINNIGFDQNLKPILFDFSRSIVLGEEDRTSRLTSVMSSTPAELALLMGENNPLMNIQLDGSVLRKSDSWRCGVALYCMITGRLPYHATSLGDYITQILTLPPTKPIEEITWISEKLKDLLYKLLENTYFNRIDIKDALKHEWFTAAKTTDTAEAALPVDVVDNIINLCKLENARNWISTITHKGYAENKQLDRDCKYFGRLDPTGQRKSLKKQMLITFIRDRLGYCQYRANQIVDEYHADCDDNGISWKEFVSTYIDIQWDKSCASYDEIRVQQFCNAMFHGLDPNGDGFVDSEILQMFLEDIGLELNLQKVVVNGQVLQQFSFDQIVYLVPEALKLKTSFDINKILSVDHPVCSTQE